MEREYTATPVEAETELLKERGCVADRGRAQGTHALALRGGILCACGNDKGRAYSILTDHLGTPTEAYDAEGNEVWSRTLDMNGEVIEETGNVGMVPFLFQGQYYDCEIGLAYNRFRYYSPKMGMYVSQDPIGLGGRILDLYGYVDDTNTWVDIFGLAKSYTSGENSAAKTGRQKHKEYKQDIAKSGHLEKEFRLPSGKKIDAIDFDNKIIYELKPNNERAKKRGQKQAEAYKKEIESIKTENGDSRYGTGWTVVVETY